MRIVASIVTYNENHNKVAEAAKSFLETRLPVELIIIDNNSSNDIVARLRGEVPKATFVVNQENYGYGKAHNIGIKMATKADYYLVLNPDIVIADGVVEELVAYMDSNPSVGLICPKILNTDGSIQHSNRRQPTVLDLFIRRMLPKFLWKLGMVQRRMAYYNMLDVGYDGIYELPSVSGCFMLFRKSVLDQLHGFDERFFMYFEDVDISIRARKLGKCIFYPKVSVVHHWARGSHKNFRLFWYHLVSAMKFFNKWGWNFF